MLVIIVFFLERRESDTKYSTVSYSNNIYSTNIDWQYDKFISGNEYRLTLSLTDSVGSTFEKIIYLSTGYNSVSYPTNLKIEPYRKHNSLIVDFSELHSITENEKIKNGHQFIAYNESTDKIDTTLEIPNNRAMLIKVILSLMIQLTAKKSYHSVRILYIQPLELTLIIPAEYLK